MQSVQDEALQGWHVGQFHPLAVFKASQGPQQVAHRISQLAIGIGGGGQDRFADPLVVGIVHHRGPKADDLGPAFADHGLGVQGVTLGLAHLLAVLIHGEAMGQHCFVGCATPGAGAFQQRRLEPAAMLVGPLKIEVGGPVGIGTTLQSEDVGASAIEPDVENVFDLLVTIRVMIAQEVGHWPGEPSIRPFDGDQVDNAFIYRRIDQRLIGFLVHKHRQWRAPGPLAADQPVGAALDHGADAVAPCLGIESRGGDGRKCRLAQGLAAGPVDGLIHADEPLRRIAENHRRAGAPGVGIAMLGPATGQQVPGLDQLVHDRCIGRAKLA